MNTLRRKGKSFQNDLLGIRSKPVLFILNFAINAPTMKYVTNAAIDLFMHAQMASVKSLTMCMYCTYKNINISPIYPIGGSYPVSGPAVAVHTPGQAHFVVRLNSYYVTFNQLNLIHHIKLNCNLRN